MFVYDPGVRQANPSTATKGEMFHVFSSSFLASLSFFFLQAMVP